MAPGAVLTKRLDTQPVSQLPFRELVGALIYISTCSRPDISFAVNKHAQFFSDPSDEHFYSALKILKYLVSTKDLGINLGGRNGESASVSVYADADFASDESSRLSITGNLIFINKSLVSWSSKRQKLIATSSTSSKVCTIRVQRY